MEQQDTNIEDLTVDDIQTDIVVLERMRRRNPPELARTDPFSEPVRQFLSRLYTDECFQRPSAYFFGGEEGGFTFETFASKVLATAQECGVHLQTLIPYQEEWDDGLGWEDETQS